MGQPGLLTTPLSGLPINLQRQLRELSLAGGCRLKSPTVAKSSPCQRWARPRAG